MSETYSCVYCGDYGIPMWIEKTHIGRNLCTDCDMILYCAISLLRPPKPVAEIIPKRPRGRPPKGGRPAVAGQP